MFLAQHDWFDGVSFHRVLAGRLAQAGDPSGTGFGGPGYTLPDEINPSRGFDEPGILGMANTGPNTGGSQFFVCHSAQPHLDGGYTVFGQVEEGLEIVDAVQEGDKIERVELVP